MNGRLIAELVMAGLVVGAFFWFCLKGMLLQRLAEKHPARFKAMGEPWVFDRWTVPGFLWRRDYRALDDPQLWKLAGFMRIWCIAYTVLCIGLGLAIFVLSHMR